jgi:hypothetical protein
MHKGEQRHQAGQDGAFDPVSAQGRGRVHDGCQDQ